MKRRVGVKRWLEWVLVTSVPLRKLDAKNMPIGIASGCLIDYGGKRFLLSAQHAIDQSSMKWVMEVRYDSNKGTEVFRPRNFNYLGEMRANSPKIHNIDLCYAEVPRDLVSHYQHIIPPDTIISERQRHIFTTNFESEPNRGEIYAFSGQVLPHRIEDIALATEMHVYPGLRFIGTRDGFYQFKLPVDHPGHDQFEGCSGAPIVDTTKNIVALVSGGNVADNTIRGVPLSRYKIAFDAYRHVVR